VAEGSGIGEAAAYVRQFDFIGQTSVQTIERQQPVRTATKALGISDELFRGPSSVMDLGHEQYCKEAIVD
jgi:hypothetical protein